MKLVSIVVTYNASEWIDRCFGSLCNASIPEHYIIAIDNGSSDKTTAVLTECYPHVELIKSESNIGFGKANNIGIKRAIELDATYVLLLNQDAWFENDELEDFLRSASQHKEYGILCPLQKSSNGNLDRKFQAYLKPELTPEIISDVFTGKLKKVYETVYVNAACWLMTSETIKTVGGFNPLFFMYGEDDNYISRLKYHGLKVGILPANNFVHQRVYEKNIDKKGKRLRSYYYHRYLVGLSNPKYSFVYNKFKTINWVLSDSFILVKRGKNFFYPFISFARCMFIFLKINKCRKQSKRSGLNFLSQI